MQTLANLYDDVVSGRWQGRIRNADAEEFLDAGRCASAAKTIGATFDSHHGDRVVIRVDSHVDDVAAMLAAWGAGLVVVPVARDAGDTVVDEIARDCNAIGVVTGGECRALDSYQPEQRTFQYRTDPTVTGVDLAMLIYTSGSTGSPKGIMLTHQNVLSALESVSTYLDIHAEDRILGLTPLSFDYGLYQILFALHRGCTTVLYRGAFNPVKVAKYIEEHTISVLPVVPVMAGSLAKLLPKIAPRMQSVRKMTNTGGHLQENVIEAWKSHLDELSVYAMYGLTECKRATYLPPEHWREKLGSVGIPIPGLEAKVFVELADDGGEIHHARPRYREADVDETGELFVRGPTVMQSYYGHKASGGATIIPGQYRDDNWLATGDLFARDADGFLYFKGRAKELIKQSGICIYPQEIEASIQRCPAVQCCAIVSTTDPRLNDECACMFVQLYGGDDEDATPFWDWLTARVNEQVTPRIVEFLDEFPTTTNGKVDKSRLAEWAEQVTERKLVS